MPILEVLFYIFVAFIGYAIGRICHIYWGYMNTPHHWIYGLILMIVGLIFYKHFLGLLAFSFGLGHFISDFKDFLGFKIISPDEEGKKRFWGID
jgi:DMSO/TMAO reductase YedYZ heme-binding membrane subunit